MILIWPNLHKYSALSHISVFQTQIQGSCMTAAEPPGAEGGEELSLFLGALNTHEPQLMLFFVLSLLQENLTD